MSITRDNHYVPQWYQEGFFEPGRNSLAYVDMTPDQKILHDGRVITHNSVWNSTPTSKAFFRTDLYSTFFGTSVNDEIERRLFGDIDTRGSRAIRAFIGNETREWSDHFHDFFEFLDIQKIRTPKGLDWLRAQYPALTQNELMLEMQGIRMLHCTIWIGGVREIVSAENSDVKFITSDHPVTVYNHAVSPTESACMYPLDPEIALRGSQTLYPMDRDNCLILTNLEYARNPSVEPLQKRTFARNYRQIIVRPDSFIRERKLTAQEVTEVNFIIKKRARRYIGGGRTEWLYPEREVSRSWKELRETLIPPRLGISKFGGEIFAKYENGDIDYQDEFGRHEEAREFLTKKPPGRSLRSGAFCGCGSGKSFKDCCQSKPDALRPTWNEKSIRERNLMLLNAIENVLDLGSGKDWVQIRRELTDDKIGEIYKLYGWLWPLETDLLALLPKPDGEARAVYTGLIHPLFITDFALGASLYFGELIVAHPFVHPGTIRRDFSPTNNPKSYRQEFLKSLLFFVKIMPLVELGLINLIPDPFDFDFHLREQVMGMAEARAPRLRPADDPRMRTTIEADFRRSISLMPVDALRREVRKLNPSLSEEELDEVERASLLMREFDPLAVLQEGSLECDKDYGQLNISKLAPNFEITMYLAQVTGASIVTDSLFRWHEVQNAIRLKPRAATPGIARLVAEIERSKFAFPQVATDIAGTALSQSGIKYRDLFQGISKYLLNVDNRGRKPNREAQLVGRFASTHSTTQRELEKSRISVKHGRISCLMPKGGVQDNAVNRLLLMSGSGSHLSCVPAAYFIELAEVNSLSAPDEPSVF